MILFLAFAALVAASECGSDSCAVTESVIGRPGELRVVTACPESQAELGAVLAEDPTVPLLLSGCGTAAKMLTPSAIDPADPWTSVSSVLSAADAKVQRQETPQFFYRDTKAVFLHLPEAKLSPGPELEAVKDDEVLIEKVRTSLSAPYRYGSWSLASLGVEGEPATEVTVAGALGGTSTKSNLWIGSTGAQARMHFDSSPNVFVQVTGRKTLLLAPPNRAASAYLYPRLHPAHRQAQVDPRRADRTRFPLLADLDFSRVTLTAGDVLFLPAFWLHQVEVDAASVSVNHFVSGTSALASSLSPKEIAGQLFQLEIPMDASWLPYERVAGLVRFLGRVYESVEARGDASVGDFARSIWATRYHDVLLEDDILTFSRSFGFVDSSEGLVRMCTKEYALLSRSKAALLDSEAKRAATLFNELPSYARSLLLSDFFEHWSIIVGLDKVPHFLHDCFDEPAAFAPVTLSLETTIDIEGEEIDESLPRPT